MARVTGTLALVLAGMMVGGGGKVASSRGVVNNKFFTFTPLSLRSDGERKMKPCCVSWPGGTYQAADGTITGSGDETFDGKLVVDGTSGWIRSIKGWTCAQSFCVHVASGNWTIADCGMKVEGGNTMPAAIVQTDRDASVLLQDCDLNGAWSADTADDDDLQQQIFGKDSETSVICGVETLAESSLVVNRTTFQGFALGCSSSAQSTATCLASRFKDCAVCLCLEEQSRCLVRDCHMQAKLGAICTKTEDCRCDVDEYSQFDGPKIFVAPSATLSNLPDLNDFPPPAGLQQVAESSGAFTHSLQEYVEREVMAAKDHAVVTKNLSSWEYVDLVLSKVSANLSECPPELQEKLVRKWEELFLSPVDEERSAGILDGLAPEDERFQQWRSAFKLTSSLQRQMIASAMLHMDSLRQRNASRDMVHEEEIPQRDLYQLLQGKGNGEAAEDGFIKWRPNRKLSAREEAERKKRIFWSTLKLINETSPHDLQLVKSLSSCLMNMTDSVSFDDPKRNMLTSIHHLLSEFNQLRGASPDAVGGEEGPGLEEPASKRTRKEEELPAGWVERISKRTGTKYFLHLSTGRSQWTRPEKDERIHASLPTHPPVPAPVLRPSVPLHPSLPPQGSPRPPQDPKFY